MQRPSPLQELPLERFLLSNPNIQPAAVKPIRSNKRPLSPGDPSPFSPAKRRILSDEGIYSPEKTLKSPLPSHVTSLGSPARFSRVLAGPTSPARVLDFGLPIDLCGDPQKRAHSSRSEVESVNTTSPSNHLTPSPELKARKARQTPTSPSSGDYSNFECDGRVYEDMLNAVTSTASSLYLYIPRELPPLPDPDSIHYPGFNVLRDPHLVVFQAKDAELPLVSNTETDTQKENLRPRRKTRKVMLDSKADQDVCSLATVTPRRTQSMNQTPKPWGSAELSSTVAKKMFRISSPTTTMRGGKTSPLQMMKDEMDIVDEGQISSDE